MSNDGTEVSDIIRRAYAAYEAKDRAALEALVADDFIFTSPQDDRIDKRTYFERCWPVSDQVEYLCIEKLFAQGNEAFVRYACKRAGGAPFRNVELFRVEHGKIVEVQVFFGFTVDDIPA
ncbi:MAG TPA: nuclear transport factor 2 family protein [Paraburkholderia sp.]|jgi:ketosteroid isomerase-like protein|nr:nuclear transport factor 2 family protein [Paraburkholderia sp.]